MITITLPLLKPWFWFAMAGSGLMIILCIYELVGIILKAAKGLRK